MSPSAESLAREARTFAAERLGAASERLLGDPAHLALVLSRVRAGDALDDAVLGVVHHEATRHEALSEEFLAFFLADLARLGHGQLGAGLRRYLDTGDLVQSVVGDLWPQLLELRFEGRERFLALLSGRLGWKAADRARELRAGRRREDRRVNVAPEELAGSAGAPSPHTQAADSEDWERLVLVLHRLAGRDREILELHLRGEAAAAVAEQLGLAPEAARKALQRALARARSLLAA